jgi:hypothetical protein
MILVIITSFAIVIYGILYITHSYDSIPIPRDGILTADMTRHLTKELLALYNIVLYIMPSPIDEVVRRRVIMAKRGTLR